MNVSNLGTVTCDNISEDLTFDDLRENKDIKIRIGGVKNKEMTLAELVSLDKLLYRSSSEEVKEESSESVKPLTDMTKANVKEAGSSMQR